MSLPFDGEIEVLMEEDRKRRARGRAASGRVPGRGPGGINV